MCPGSTASGAVGPESLTFPCPWYCHRLQGDSIVLLGHAILTVSLFTLSLATNSLMQMPTNLIPNWAKFSFGRQFVKVF